MKKLALVYDRINKIGGAEKVLSAINDIWPDSQWFTSVYDPSRAKFAKSWSVHASFLNNIPILRTRHELVPYLMPFVFENFDFSNFECVISISSAEAKGIITKPETLHINYCLTPTRYLWSHKDSYINSPQLKLLKSIGKPFINTIVKNMKTWDMVASHRPDVMIAISEHVKKRIKKYYNRDSIVIYPPVQTSIFKNKNTSQNNISVDTGGIDIKTNPMHKQYYLVVSRLVPYKNIDFIIKTFNTTNKTLVIIGEGADMKRLKSIANDNIIFKGHVPQRHLPSYYQHATAFIQANEEDFGIAMVEAQASGCPVIALNTGGAKEIVINNKTGILFNSKQPEKLLHSMNKIETMKLSKATIQKNASRFDEKIFKQKFKSTIEELCRQNTKTLKSTFL